MIFVYLLIGLILSTIYALIEKKKKTWGRDGKIDSFEFGYIAIFWPAFAFTYICLFFLKLLARILDKLIQTYLTFVYRGINIVKWCVQKSEEENE
jgi:hypothetical protein